MKSQYVNTEILVSVVMPCYNAEKYLREALQSMIDQTYKSIEVILIDDGCSDSSPIIYNSFRTSDNRIRIIKNDTNIGLIASLNKGISEAKGKYIARMDADDVSAPNRIEKQVCFLESNPELDIIGTKAIPIDINGQKIRNNNFNILTDSKTLAFSSYFTQPFFHGSIVGKASCLKNNPYSENFKHSEDFELWLRLNSKGYQLGNLSDELYLYRINPEGVSISNEGKQKQSHNFASQQYLQLLLNQPISNNIVALLNNRPTHFSLEEFKASNKLFKKIGELKRIKEHSEGKKYFYNQQLNIYLQAIKKAKTLKIKLDIFFKTAEIMFKVNNLKYLMNKIF